MKRLAGASELLDGALDPPILAGNLDDLERINARGGAALSAQAIRKLRELRRIAGPLRLLDVGTGGGDIPRYLHRSADGDAALETTATDVRPEIVEMARSRSVGVIGLTVSLSSDDRLEYTDDSFDIVHSSLVLHHLEPAAAVALLREMRRVSRVGVVVNDLDRGWLWWAGAWLYSHTLTRNKYTRDDAPLSVRRAYRPLEVAAMAANAGLREVARVRTRPPYRYALAFVRA